MKETTTTITRTVRTFDAEESAQYLNDHPAEVELPAGDYHRITGNTVAVATRDEWADSPIDEDCWGYPRDTFFVSLWPDALSSDDSEESRDVAAFAATVAWAPHPTRAIVRYVERTYKPTACHLVNVYSHSGVTISMIGDNLIGDPDIDARVGRTGWDSANAALVFSTHPDKAVAEQLCRGMVETYDAYLTGDVWRVTLHELTVEQVSVDGGPFETLTTWEEYDSCGGLYGHDNMMAELESR